MNATVHRCGDECVCPIHGTQLVYWPAGNDHACQDPACQFGRGGWQPGYYYTVRATGVADEPFRAQLQRDICRAFGVKPYLVGIGAPPRWHKMLRPARRLFQRAWYWRTLRWRDGRWVEVRRGG